MLYSDYSRYRFISNLFDAYPWLPTATIEALVYAAVFIMATVGIVALARKLGEKGR